MTKTVFCIVILALTLAVVCYAVFLAIRAKVNETRMQSDGGSKGDLRPFHFLLGGVFLALLVLTYPVCYYGEFANDAPVLREIKTLFVTVYNTTATFFCDGDFEALSGFLAEEGMNARLVGVYSSTATVLFFLSPIMTAGVVLSFFKNLSSVLKYRFFPRGEVYLMSELNERSIALAENILDKSKAQTSEEKRAFKRKLVVFADVFEKEEEENFELVNRAKRLGAICMKRDIADIGLRKGKDKCRKIYFISEEEDENVKQAIALLKQCRTDVRYKEKLNDYNTQFYVFATDAVSEVLLDATDKGNMKLRRINENRNLVLSTIRTSTVFSDALPAKQEGEEKEIHLLIVGLGAYGTELLKAVCWCGQMIGYRLHVTVMDKDEEVESRIQSLAPELLTYNYKRMAGAPYYEIDILGGVDVTDSSLDIKLKEVGEVTTAFVTLGHDELNVEAAMRLRRYFGRRHIKTDGQMQVPNIYAVVYNAVKMQTLDKGEGLRGLPGGDYPQGESYGIHLIGGLAERYTVSVIEQLDLEEEGLNCHQSWVRADGIAKMKAAESMADKVAAELELKEKEHKNLQKYENFEYYRRASMAEAMYATLRETLGVVTGDGSPYTEEQIADAERKRWVAYMRAEGYIGAKKRSDVARTHPKLIYEEQVDEDVRRIDAMIAAGKKKQKKEGK